MGQYGRPPLATAGLLVKINCRHVDADAWKFRVKSQASGYL